ncbi:MAG: helix-turn-helix transcriptional regulator [Slackia sp.]
MSFRNNLQHLRATRNMTQEQLAMFLGVSRQSVTKWEAEKSYPEMDKLLKMCSFFECSLDDLVTDDLTNRPAEDATAPKMPGGPATDICGYDDHAKSLAWRIPTGIAFIMLGIAWTIFVDGDPTGILHEGDPLAVAGLFAGIVAGMAVLIPAGMRHSAFVKSIHISRTSTEEARRAQLEPALS